MRTNKIKLLILATFFIAFTLLSSCMYEQQIEDIPVLIDLRDIGYENSEVYGLRDGTTTYNTLYYQIAVGEKESTQIEFTIYQNDNTEKLDKYYEYLMIDFEKSIDKLNSSCQEGCIQLGNPHKEKYANIKKYMNNISSEWNVQEAYVDPDDEIIMQRIFIREKNKIIVISYFFDNPIEITDEMKRYIVSLVDIDLGKIKRNEKIK